MDGLTLLTMADAQTLVRDFITEKGSTVKSIDDAALINDVICEYKFVVTLGDGTQQAYHIDDRKIVWQA